MSDAQVAFISVGIVVCFLAFLACAAGALVLNRAERRASRRPDSLFMAARKGARQKKTRRVGLSVVAKSG